MTPAAPIGRTDVVSLTVKLNEQAMSDECRVASIKVTREVNRLGMAHIVLLADDRSRELFEITQADTPVPGVSVEIRLGYGRDDEVVFKGMIAKHGMQVHKDGQCLLVLTCTDSAVRMTAVSKSAVYRGQSESAIWQALLASHGLHLTSSGGVLDRAGEGPPPDLVRAYSSDWDFLLTRAQASGLLVLVDNAELTIAPPKLDDNACELCINFGESMFALNAEIDSFEQLNSFGVHGRDMADQAGQTSAAPIGSVAVQDCATGHLRTSRLAKISGTVSFQGSALAVPGKTITLGGLGAPMDGDVFVARVEHTFKQRGWVTEVAFGMSPHWFGVSHPC